ncbi:MAG TPA: NAD(P)-dependent oxidoreductase, partial [Candidatus Micrarchaeota archaeon]|nr:NAD(P)-dependent oxidoreductase [Candidatus Micrarchaeota archaeon]
IFINVTRGEIAPESGLLELYRSGKIGGLGLDVFSNEEEFSRAMRGGAVSPGKDIIAARELGGMSLERTGNIYVQPHQGFNSDIAARAKAREAIRHAEAHFRNRKEKFDEQLPYYR